VKACECFGSGIHAGEAFLQGSHLSDVPGAYPHVSGASQEDSGVQEKEATLLQTV